MRVLLTAVAGALLSLTSIASAGCYGTPEFTTCSDSSGNRYSVQRLGDQTYTRGHNYNTGSSWSQTDQTIGDQTYTRGRSSDGDTWNKTQTNLGGGYRSYSGRDSDGNSFSGVCGPLGCN